MLSAKSLSQGNIAVDFSGIQFVESLVEHKGRQAVFPNAWDPNHSKITLNLHSENGQ